MSTTSPGAQQPCAADSALDELRRPITCYEPENTSGSVFQGAMLALADLHEELAEDGESEGLEAVLIRTLLQSFPGLVASGPTPKDLSSCFLGGHLIDGEAADTLYTLGSIQRILGAFEPCGFSAALQRTALLAVYRLISVFVVFDDRRGIAQCRELLNTAEELAERLEQRP